MKTAIHWVLAGLVGAVSVQAEASCSVYVIVPPVLSLDQSAKISAALLTRGFVAQMVSEETSMMTDVLEGEKFIETDLGGIDAPSFSISLYETREAFDLTSHLPHLGQYADAIWSRTENYSSVGANGLPSVVVFSRTVEKAVGTLPRCR
jgi:hypothetical protein